MIIFRMEITIFSYLAFELNLMIMMMMTILPLFLFFYLSSLSG